MGGKYCLADIVLPGLGGTTCFIGEVDRIGIPKYIPHCAPKHFTPLALHTLLDEEDEEDDIRNMVRRFERDSES